MFLLSTLKLSRPLSRLSLFVEQELCVAVLHHEVWVGIWYTFRGRVLWGTFAAFFLFSQIGRGFVEGNNPPFLGRAQPFLSPS